MSATPLIHVFFGGNSATILYRVVEFQFVTPGFYVNGTGLVDARVLSIDKSVPNETTVTLADDAQFQEGDYIFSSPVSPPNIVIRPRAMDSAIQFWWHPSAGGENITQYCILGGTPPTSLVVSSNVTTAMISGLTNGTNQSYYLVASNAEVGGFGTPFRTVQPGFQPSPPQNVEYTQVSDQATVTWNASTSDGSSVIRYYFIHGESSNPSDPDISGSVYGNVLTRTFGGLNSESTYTFTVKAINDVQHSAFA